MSSLVYITSLFVIMTCINASFVLSLLLLKSLWIRVSLFSPYYIIALIDLHPALNFISKVCVCVSMCVVCTGLGIR